MVMKYLINARKKSQMLLPVLTFKVDVDYLDNPKCLNKSNKS